MQDTDAKPDPVLEERKFLHDIATPLGVAIGYSDILAMSLQKKGESCADECKKVEKVLKALQTVSTLLEARRSVIKSRS